MKVRIAEGRLEPTGSMWVEADCNIPSGESLVRQIFYGKRFYRRELGIETNDVWLPDVFGYSAALPQIMRRSGIRWFLTQKLSWNQYNVAPPSQLPVGGDRRVEGLHPLPPGRHLQRQCQRPPSSATAWRTSRTTSGPRARSICSDGVTAGEARPARCWSRPAGSRTSRASPGSPWKGPAPSSPRPRRTSAIPPSGSASSISSYHRGTYTSQAATKLGNRRSEFALRDAELWSSLADGAADPAAELEELWKVLLLHQFHDIIPGSGIHWVYQDTARDHARIVEGAQRA